jgi:hypothetical protein
MTHRILFLIALLGGAIGCGEDMEPDPGPGPGDGPPGMSGTFDEELPVFRATICDHAVKCIGQDRATCEAEVTAGMASAKAALDDAGEARCARCMDVRGTELAKVVAASCDHMAGDAEAVFAACDLDPAVDYDGDDNTGNDNDEACAGFP